MGVRGTPKLLSTAHPSAAAIDLRYRSIIPKIEEPPALAARNGAGDCMRVFAACEAAVCIAAFATMSIIPWHLHALARLAGTAAVA
jgi:hypothetical protein